ncbi:hypothetical protein, partial [Escherichia ruysiae]|uniref:hypothetical protein n=1 Tax=Escherichia ruysiae TaxID=2608867 RepID=UPI003DA3E8DE
ENTNGELIPESKATIKVYKTEDKMAVSVPSQSIIFDNNKYFVVVYHSQNDVKVKEVTVDRQTDDVAYISSGIKAGDRVITHNQ